MAFSVKTIECFPRPIMVGDLNLGTPDADHEHCSGGEMIDGLLGGWTCPCPCHREKAVGA